MKSTRQHSEAELAAADLGSLLADCVPPERFHLVQKAIERLARALYTQGFQAGAIDRQAVASLLGAILERST